MNNQGIKEVLIHQFWEKVTNENKLSLLKEMAEIVFYHPRTVVNLRAHFDRIKKRWRKYKTEKGCFVCSSKATILHHIIQLQNGGNNSRRNIVGLCCKCHAEIHPWLVL